MGASLYLSLTDFCVMFLALHFCLVYRLLTSPMPFNMSVLVMHPALVEMSTHMPVCLFPCSRKLLSLFLLLGPAGHLAVWLTLHLCVCSCTVCAQMDNQTGSQGFYSQNVKAICSFED